MIKDFVPARAGLATGVIVKQHILERNRYRAPQAQWENDIYTGSVATLSTGYDTGSVIYTFTGGTGGKLSNICECIIVPSFSTEKIQEVHIMLGHILCFLIEEKLFKKND